MPRVTRMYVTLHESRVPFNDDQTPIFWTKRENWFIEPDWCACITIGFANNQPQVVALADRLMSPNYPTINNQCFGRRL